MIDLDPEPTAPPADLANELLYPDAENQIVHRGDRRRVARLVRTGEEAVRLALPDETDWLLGVGEDGALCGLRTPPPPLEPREVRLGVEAAGLNFWDVFAALGLIDEKFLGTEMCGHVIEVGPEVKSVSVGDRVVGVRRGARGMFGPEAVTHEELVAPAPADMPATALATMPTVFLSAALSYELAGLKAGDRVLIHAGAGGVGLAALQLAQAAGAEVFATASAPKQAYLRSLGVERVFDSRTTAFGEEILEATGGEGVDLILNSLTAEGYIEASLSCLAEGGRFVELAARDILSEEEMAAARPDAAYHIVKLDAMKEDELERPGALLRDVMARLAAGELTPLTHTRWPMNEARRAVEFMRDGRHIGKIIFTNSPLARGRLREEGTYLVTGGLGGIGCAVAGWLAERGAGTIVLNGRRPPDPEVEEAIESLRRRRFTVRVELADVTDPDAVDEMLARMDAELPPLCGVIHSVGVLSDGALGNQSWGRFEQVLWPKVLWRVASPPRDGFSRPGHVRPLLERGRRTGESGSGEPRSGQRVPGPARRPPPGAGTSGSGHRLGRVVGDWRSRGAAGENLQKHRRNGSRLDDAAAGALGHSTGWSARTPRIPWFWRGIGLNSKRPWTAFPRFSKNCFPSRRTQRPTRPPWRTTCCPVWRRRPLRSARPCWSRSCSRNCRRCSGCRARPNPRWDFRSGHGLAHGRGTPQPAEPRVRGRLFGPEHGGVRLSRHRGARPSPGR